MSNRIYIGRLSSRTSERDIERFFKGFGRIRFISLKNGYGFVDLEDERDADDAVYELHGKELLGERVIVEHAKGPTKKSFRDGPQQRFARGPRPTWLEKYGAPVRTGYKLVVENLSSRVSWQDLKDYMRQAGDVTFADAHKEVKNVGVVEFASYSDMKKAIDKLDGTEINGRKIKLVEDANNRAGSHSRSRSRGRSTSRPRRNDRRRADSRSADRKDRSYSGRRGRNSESLSGDRSGRRNRKSESGDRERRDRRSRSQSEDGNKRYKRSYRNKSDEGSRSRTKRDHSGSVGQDDDRNSRSHSRNDDRKESRNARNRSGSGKRKDNGDERRHHNSSCDEDRKKSNSRKRSRSSSRGSSRINKRTKNRSYSRSSESEKE